MTFITYTWNFKNIVPIFFGSEMKANIARWQQPLNPYLAGGVVFHFSRKKKKKKKKRA